MTSTGAIAVWPGVGFKMPERAITLPSLMVVWLRDLLGGLSDEPSSGDVVWSRSTLWLRVAEFAALLEALGDNLVVVCQSQAVARPRASAYGGQVSDDGHQPIEAEPLRQ